MRLLALCLATASGSCGVLLATGVGAVGFCYFLKAPSTATVLDSIFKDVKIYLIPYYLIPVLHVEIRRQLAGVGSLLPPTTLVLGNRTQVSVKLGGGYCYLLSVSPTLNPTFSFFSFYSASVCALVCVWT